MAIMKMNDLEMYYEIHGSGVPMVLIAGYTCDHSFWENLVAAMAARFQVITLDNRGVGRSKDSGEPFSIETMARDTACLMERLGLSRPIVVGQSMGGAIAQTVLAQYPAACGKCIILNSTSSFSARTLMVFENLLALRKAGVDLDLLLDASLAWLSASDWMLQPGNVAAFKAAVRDNPMPQSLFDQERQFHALKTFAPSTHSTAWNDRSLVISASDDLITTTREGKLLAKRLGAEYVEIPGGHPSPVEQPELLSRLMLKFLA